MSKAKQLEQDIDRLGYKIQSEKSSKRLDLNILLKRNKERDKKDRKFNLLILSGVSLVVIAVLILLSI